MYLVRMTSDEYGNDDYPRETMAEALATIERLVISATAIDDGVERLIGIMVNPTTMNGWAIDDA